MKCLEYAECYEKVCMIIAKVLRIRREAIQAEMLLDGSVGEDGLNMDSLEYVNIIIAIEEEFGIVVDYQASFNTVDELTHYILSSVCYTSGVINK